MARRLDAFEEALGLHLFDRLADGTHATAATEQLLPYAESMEQAALAMDHTLDGFEAEPQGVVRVTAPPGVADHFMAPVIGDLITRFPKLRIELESSIGYSDLTRREADIALRANRPKSGDLIAKRLGEAESRLICAKGSRSGALRALDDVPWVTYAADLGHLPECAWITEQVSEDRIVIRSNSITVQLNAVRSGPFVTLASKPFIHLDGVEELTLSRSLKRKTAPFPIGGLWLVGHRALREVPRVAVVWSFIEEQFERTLGSR